MNKTSVKFGVLFSDSALKDASNDPMLVSEGNGGRSADARRTESELRATGGTQGANYHENLRAELRAAECTMSLFRNEISQSLDNALRLDFVS